MGTFTIPTSPLGGGDLLRGPVDEEPQPEPEPEPETPPPSTSSGGWWGLVDIAREARTEAAREATWPLTACPLCGTPLDHNSRGQVRCRFDGWEPRWGNQ